LIALIVDIFLRKEKKRPAKGGFSALAMELELAL
jgi:hypothetical protein